LSVPPGTSWRSWVARRFGVADQTRYGCVGGTEVRRHPSDTWSTR
jgi:hypothetical protein